MNNLKKLYIGITGIIKYFLYILICKIRKQKQYIMFSTPRHGNLGDHAITYAEEQFFKRCGIKIFEVVNFDVDCYIKILNKRLPRDAVLLINGGGFLGSHWFKEEQSVRKVILNFPNNKIIIFPQTIYYEDTEFGKNQLKKSKEIYNNHSNLIMIAREETSFKFIKENYTNVKAIKMPDMVLYLKPLEGNKKRTKILLCLRQDKEKNLNKKQEEEIKKIIKESKIQCINTDTVIKKRILKIQRSTKIKKKIKEFQQARIIITDRLHGMIFAYITKTPCIVLSNYNYKIKGVYKWIEKCNYIKYVENIDDFEILFNSLIQIKDKLTLKDFKEFDLLRNIILEEE